MKNIYDYIFFQLEQSLERAKSITSVSTAIMLFAFIQGVNILTILKLLKVELEPLLIFNLFTFVLFFIVLVVLNGLYLIIKMNYKNIIATYIVKSEEERKKGWIYVRLYLIVSIILFFVIIIYRSNHS